MSVSVSVSAVAHVVLGCSCTTLPVTVPGGTAQNPGAVELAAPKRAAIGSGYRRMSEDARVAQPGLRQINAGVHCAGLRGTGKQYGEERLTRFFGPSHDSLDPAVRWGNVRATQTCGKPFRTPQSFERLWPDASQAWR